MALLTLLAGMAGLGLFLLRHGGPRTAVVSAPAPSAGIPARAQEHATAGVPGTGPDLSPETVPGRTQRFVVGVSLLAALRPGDCLAWSPDPDHEVTPVRVPCDQPHVDEVTRIVDLTGTFTVWPGRPALGAAATTDCAGASRNILGTADAAPHTQAASIYPEESGWLAGARGVVCTIRADDFQPRAGSLRAHGVPA